MRVGVFGASGLVGTAVVERLLARSDCEVVPFIHGTGNAARLARLGVELHRLDLLDAAELKAGLRGCTHVVNASRGDERVMLRGLKNLLEASANAGVRKFVHLSSVMVYGDPPHAASTAESAPTVQSAKDSGYGWIKLQQDRMVERAARRGLRSTVLCPPNISGPYSYYLLGILDALRAGTFALVDGGNHPCALVDVENLVHAIELSLTADASDGSRMFVTDNECIQWKHLIHELAPLLPHGATACLPAVTASELREKLRSRNESNISVGRAVRHLLSSDVRTALRKDPLLAKVDRALRNVAALMGSSMEARLRRSLEGASPAAGPETPSSINAVLSAHQLRDVVHSSQRAQSLLGYRPPHTFASSMAAFRAWYSRQVGTSLPNGDLFEHLSALPR